MDRDTHDARSWSVSCSAPAATIWGSRRNSSWCRSRPRPRRRGSSSSSPTHDEGTDSALRYAELVNADAVTCVHAEELSPTTSSTPGMRPTRDTLGVIPDDNESIPRRAVRRVRQERDSHPEAIVTVILADRVRTRSILAPFTHRHSLAIKSRLLFEPGRGGHRPQCPGSLTTRQSPSSDPEDRTSGARLRHDPPDQGGARPTP